MTKSLTAIFFLLSFITAYGQEADALLSGTMKGDDGDPLPFGTVVLEGTPHGVAADEDGRFEFRVPAGKYVLVGSYVGYKRYKINVDIGAGAHKQFDLVLAGANDVLIKGCIVVLAKRPFAQQVIDKEAIEKENLGQDVPYVLQYTPSAVVTSDAGAGVGYTGIRLRGSDQTNINVMVNGIPLNDAESHQVYWVDLPDILASANQIEIQRGVGTSTNGAGAFGGSINVSTMGDMKKEPFAKVNGSIGSFGTRKGSIELGTGLLANRISIEGRYSLITSDGYIDRASANLSSFFAKANYQDNRSTVQVNAFTGHEVTYQAWYGIPKSYADDDELRTYNPAGTERPGEPHPDQVDNYRQSHFQGIFAHKFDQWKLQTALHYTKGKGYYEEYKAVSQFSDYGLAPIEVGDSIYSQADLIRRRWLDNDFYGLTYNLQSDRLLNQKLRLNVGGAWNKYLGDHFGEVIWTQVKDFKANPAQYYFNDAAKTDFSVYAKADYYPVDNLSIFGDVQFRQVDYTFLGKDADGGELTAQVSHPFINPKVGLSYHIGSDQFYTSFAVAHREPNRDDYKNSSPNSRPKEEQLLDFEIGWNRTKLRHWLQLNGFFMLYKDQLVLTGAINDVGEYVRTNVDDSYRMGIEASWKYPIRSKWTLQGNATVSQHKIKAFNEYIDNWETWEQDVVLHENTNLSFSPMLNGMLSLAYQPIKNRRGANLTLELIQQYVGKQYADNTSNEHTAIPAYAPMDFRILFDRKGKNMTYQLNAKVNNLLNRHYFSNAWVYRYANAINSPLGDYDQSEGGRMYSQMGVYPQAGRHFLVGLTVLF